MLELRPSCENCNKLLPPDSTEARICSYECTYCKDCAEEQLHNVCPNCGGGFCQRPIRPKKDWKNGNCLANDPASTNVILKPVDLALHRAFSKEIREITPEQR